jgi:hypothetical protein
VRKQPKRGYKPGCSVKNNKKIFCQLLEENLRIVLDWLTVTLTANFHQLKNRFYKYLKSIEEGCFSQKHTFRRKCNHFGSF